MAHIVVLGGGIGGVSCAYELKQRVRREDLVTLISNKPFLVTAHRRFRRSTNHTDTIACLDRQG